MFKKSYLPYNYKNLSRNREDDSNPKWQWNAPDVGFMLNSDMCLIKVTNHLGTKQIQLI